MIKIAICDDSEQMLEMIYSKVQTFFTEKDIKCDIILYSKSNYLIYDIQEKRCFDLILTDIEMPDVNGMCLVERIRQYLPEVLIMFITAYDYYVFDSFILNIFRYIPKNEIDDRLQDALDDALKIIQMQDDSFYIIDLPQRYEKISLRKIMYIQWDGKKNCVITMDGNTEIRIRKSLKQLYSEMNFCDFIFAGRDLVINVNYLKSIKKDCFIMDNGSVFLVPEHRLEKVRDELRIFWRKRV